MTLEELKKELTAKHFLLYVDNKQRGTNNEIQRKIEDLKLKISSEKINYVLWSTSAIILVFFLAKRNKMF